MKMSLRKEVGFLLGSRWAWAPGSVWWEEETASWLELNTSPNEPT